MPLQSMGSPTQTPTNQEIAEHYDQLGEFYREVWGDELHHGYWEHGTESVEEAIRHLSDTIVEQAKISCGNQVCDVGSGYGTLAVRLASEVNAQVHGWTLSSQQAKLAEEKAAELEPSIPRPKFHCEDWFENNLPAASCHAILSIESLSHVAEKEDFFVEACRLLRPQGRLVISDWLAPDTISFRQKEWLLEPICRDGCLAKLASKDTLLKIAGEAELKVVESLEIGARVRKTWRVISARLLGKVLTNAAYRKFFWDNLRSSRVFALTIARLLIAYQTRALEYRLLVFEKPTTGTEQIS